MPDAQILALGGGRSDAWQPYRALDDHLLSIAGGERPRVCLLPTASGDAPGMIAGFHAAFGPQRAAASHLALFDRTVADLRGLLLAQDAIVVGGGSSPNLLAIWRLHGVDTILREAWAAGVVLCGWSAGALCWFQGGTTNALGAGVEPLRDGLGLLPGSLSPHDDSQPARRPAYELAVRTGALPAGYALDDAAALHFRGRALEAVLTCDPASRAHRVEPGGATPLPARLLASPPR